MKEAGLSDNKASFCPSCERFIGPADVCPYCDADSARPPVFRFMRNLALLVALAGLAILLLAVRHTEIPVITAGEITPMMNFANVRVSGRVIRPPYVSGERKAEYLSFVIEDGSGELRVTADGRIARQLIDKLLLPAKGDSVDVVGTVNISADGKMKLRILAAEKVNITEKASNARPTAVAGRAAPREPRERKNQDLDE